MPSSQRLVENGKESMTMRSLTEGTTRNEALPRSKRINILSLTDTVKLSLKKETWWHGECLCCSTHKSWQHLVMKRARTLGTQNTWNTSACKCTHPRTHTATSIHKNYKENTYRTGLSWEGQFMCICWYLVSNFKTFPCDHAVFKEWLSSNLVRMWSDELSPLCLVRLTGELTGSHWALLINAEMPTLDWHNTSCHTWQSTL